MKAKYIGKYYYREYVFLEYEYKGYKYEVYENRAKGNEPLAWQHRNEQSRIDKLIKSKNSSNNGNPINLDEIWEMMEWD